MDDWSLTRPQADEDANQETALGELIAFSSDSIKVLDLDGRVVRWNESSETLYGWTEEEVIGEYFPYVSEDLRLRALRDLRAIAAAGRGVRREVAALRKDGSQFVARVLILPIWDGDGHPSGVLTVARSAAKDIKHLTTGDSSPVMARVLKSSLTAVGGYAQLLGRAEIVDEPSRRVRTLNALSGRVEAMTGVIDCLLLASGLDEGTVHLNLESVDMAGLLADVVARFEQHLETAGIIIDYEAGIGPVQADRALLGRAMTTLLSTLMRDADPRVDICVSAEDMGVVVAMTATGVDPTALSMASVFGVESQGPEIVDVDNGARELELYIARRIVEAHGGHARSQFIDEGLVFRIYVPLEA